MHVKPCSLSKARNEGIKLIPEGESGIIAFPDDDCWYNSTVLSAAVKNLEQYDFVSMGIYAPIKRKGFGKHRTLNEKCEINEDNVLLKPISVSIFYKFNEKNEIPLFDEKFGVLFNGKKGVYDSTDTVYHETEREKDFNASVTYKYSVGFAAMIMKSLLVRGQKKAYARFRKLMTRSRLAQIYYLFKPAKKAVYAARLKGFKRGLKEGRVYYKGYKNE